MPTPRHLVTVLVLTALGGIASAVDVFPHPPPGDPMAKVSSELRPYLAAGAAVDARLRSRTVAASRPDLMKLVLDVPVTAANLAAIAATGATVSETSEPYNAVTVEATPAQAGAIAALAVVAKVSPARKPRLRAPPAVGTYANEADPLIATDTLRATYGVDGSGMTIGVMSDSINSVDHGTLSNGILTNLASQVSGNLPATIKVIASPTTPGTDEGRGMMEEVHHLAPGAACVFAACGDTETAMAANIAKFTSKGHCQVAVDDIGFYDEPMFQDGPIAKAANTFVADGGIYLSAAGNSGTTGILQTFADTGSGLHNWGHGTSNGFLPLTMPDDSVLTVVLQWNQSYHSYGLGKGAQTDFDLGLFDAQVFAQANFITGGGDVQGTTGHPAGDPFEILQYHNTTGATRTVYLAVDLYAGSGTNLVLRLACDLSRTSQTLTSSAAGIFNCGTTYGHPVATGVLGVGAVDAASSTDLENFSSAGGWGAWPVAGDPASYNYHGLPFYTFSATTGLVTGSPDIRNKPDICAPDGVTTDWSYSLVSSGPFYGTSSAAPHAAAAAALVWSVRPSLSNTQVMDLLRDTATDLANAPASTGDEAFSGHGLVDAFAASGTAVTSVTTAASAGLHTAGTIPITVHFSHAVDVTGTPTLLLNTAPARSATYTGGTGTTALTFTYTIALGDDSSLLEGASAAAISLNGGTIERSGGSENADLTLPVTGGRSLSGSTAMSVSAHGPTLTIVSTPHASQTDPDFVFTFTFSHAVTAFNAGMITWTNTTGATAPSTVDNITWTSTATAAAKGAVIATVAASATSDADGYPSGGATGQAGYQTSSGSSGGGGGGGGGGGCGAGTGTAILLGLSLILLRLRRRD